MTSGKGGYLIQKEKLGIGQTHNGALAIIEGGLTDQPCLECPSAFEEDFRFGIMQPSAVSHEKAAR